MAEPLIFQDSPVIEVAGNKFVNVAVVLQYEQTPLMEVVSVQRAGFTTQFSIYHKDGTYLAKVKGSQMYLTEDGKKAGLSLRHPGLVTVCEMGGKTLFELRRDQAAALKTSAELYAPGGAFVKLNPADIGGVIDISGGKIDIAGVGFTNCEFRNLPVGLWVASNGLVGIGGYPTPPNAGA